MPNQLTETGDELTAALLAFDNAGDTRAAKLLAFLQLKKSPGRPRVNDTDALGAIADLMAMGQKQCTAIGVVARRLDAKHKDTQRWRDRLRNRK